jgi:hypothetical protein
MLPASPPEGALGDAAVPECRSAASSRVSCYALSFSMAVTTSGISEASRPAHAAFSSG